MNFLNGFIQKREKPASLSTSTPNNFNFGVFLSELYLLKDKPSSKSVKKARYQRLQKKIKRTFSFKENLSKKIRT